MCAFARASLTFTRRADLTLSCTSAKYRSLRAFAIFGILLYPVGVNAVTASLLWRARDDIRHRNGANAGHLVFLYNHYSPRFFAWEVVDNLRRIALTGGAARPYALPLEITVFSAGLVLIPERNRAAGGTILALSVYALYENARPYKRAENNVIASVANAVVATLFVDFQKPVK